MIPNYTNAITTVRHPRYGSLRLIYINLTPWLCLEDFARILGTLPEKLSCQATTERGKAHVEGCSFIRPCHLPIRMLSRKPALQRWIRSLLTDGGLPGPRSNSKPRKLHDGLDSPSTISLRHLYKYCENSLPYYPYDEWKLHLAKEIEDGHQNFAPCLRELKQDRILIKNAEITLICECFSYTTSRMLWVVLNEYKQGWHSQSSLDDAVELATTLIPDSSETVDAASLHAFLQIPGPFHLWLNEQIYWQGLRLGVDYRIEGTLRFLPLSFDFSTDTARPRLSLTCSEQIIARVPTPRGESVREQIADESDGD